MRLVSLFLALTLSCLASPLTAQEGHPLKGSWIGTWEGNKIHGNDVLVILDWDGKAISGVVNPGTDDMTIKNASLQPDGWVVHFEVDGKDRNGNAVAYVIDGKIEGLAFHNRTITGTWKSQRGGGGAFAISRQ